MPQLWEVVGGADKGGILVREGRGTDTKQCPERLSTGALVEELELAGERLNYKLVTGTGPPKGWISIKLPGKELARRFDEDAGGGGQAAEDDGEDLTTEQRCARELAKDGVPWFPIGREQMMATHEKASKGIIYGLEFPWTAATLAEMGPKWCTRAFRAAASIPKGVTVTKVKDIKEHIGGGACSKIIFDVEYDGDATGLHTRLFAKIPFPPSGKTMSDRMASSINSQGADLMEINTSRLLESRLPFPIPRFYYGDISNETTNFIQITERVPFGEKIGDKQYDPPYDKMKDWELKGPAEEYYYLIVKVGAQMAGMYKAEKIAPPEVLHKFYDSTEWRGPEMWGMGPHSTGLPDNELKAKMRMGVDFIGTTGKAIFPEHLTTPEFLNTYKTVLATVNAYTAETNFWCNRDKDYIAWSHGNINVDNVFFWRDPESALNVGVLDWGGARCDSMGWKLWWWLYCCEYDFLKANIDGMLDCFIQEYQAHGGPLLDREELKWQFILSALNQGVGLLGAVPQIYGMCPKKQWATITDRKDERIQANVNGKNTLRVYIGTFINICNMIYDWDIPRKLDEWVEKVSALGIPRKKVDVSQM